jgi:hypothetical protein
MSLRHSDTISIYNKLGITIMSEYSVEIVEVNKGTSVAVLFGKEEHLESVAFGIGPKMLYVTQDNLSLSATGALTSLAEFIGFEQDSDEVSLVIHADDKYLMHISTSGLYVRFTINEKEVLYWDAGEFKETPSEVMGAFCGALLTAFFHGEMFHGEMIGISKVSPVKTAEAKQVLQLMDSCDDGDNRCVEFIKQVSEKSGKSYDQISKELEQFI